MASSATISPARKRRKGPKVYAWNMTTFTYPQKLTPVQFSSLKANLQSQKANVSGPDTALSIKNFHGVDFLANFAAPVSSNAAGSLAISIVKKHGMSELASDADVQKKVEQAIAEVVGQTT
jgi:hypothetical protein